MVDFTRFMGRGKATKEPLGTIKTAAPKTTKAPLGYIKTAAPAPAPMPAPVAPLPNIDLSNLDLSNLDLSNVPGLPQLPPMTVEPAPAPVPVTPPPTPPISVAPPLEPRVAPAPLPEPVVPPPIPPVPVAPPPAPVPTPAPPPIVPPVLTAPSNRVSEPAPAPAPTPVAPPPAPVLPAPATIPPIDLSNIDLSNLDLSNINVPSMPAAAPTPPPVPTLTPEPSPLVPPVQTAPSNRVSEPAPEPAVGIETLAPDDFTAPVTPPFSPSEQMGFNALEPRDGPLPAGIAAGPMSTPSVNTRAEAVEAGIPMPDGSQFNPSFTDFSGMEFDSEGIPMVDPVIIQNALAEAGIETPATGGASTFTPNLDAGLTLGDTLLTEPTPTVSSFQPEAGGFTLTPEQQAAIDAAIGSGSFSLIDDSYGFTDGQQDAAGVIPGAGAAANATTNASTNPNAGQDWYENMTDEQREAYDAFIAGGGLANIPGGTIDLGAIGGGTVNIPGIGGYTGTTPRPVVEAIQNLTVNRDPTLAGNVSAATQYGLTGAPPVQAPSTNPFQRPETQQGIGSLAGGG